MNKLSALFISIVFTSTFADVHAQPWRFSDSGLLPDWLTLSGQQRTRFETLNNQYRANGNGGDQVLAFRTNIMARLDFDTVQFAGEMMDARANLADTGTPLNNTVVNPLELLQAYVEIPFQGLISSNSQSSLKGGRLTMDVGSRRFVARNRFRNTINAFTGVDFQWQNTDSQSFRAFFTFPVQRLVSGNFLDNDARFDAEYDEVKFWGAYFSPASLLWGEQHKGEIYFLGLDEDDVPGLLSTRNRELYTLVTRVFSKPRPGHYYYDVESAVQFGHSRASTTATADLDHFAYFVHLQTGYSFNASWSPELIFQYDYASGDDDANDGENNRFDTLFGARRFEFGPTGIYGAFARSNLSTPGLRLQLKPGANITSFIALRGFWLASTEDSWTTANISNINNDSDSYIGTQLEASIRWDVLPGNLRVETGAAILFAGDIMTNANKTDTSYFYSQWIFSF